MKKILFLLLCTVSIYGQTYPTNPTAFGKISINTNIEDNTATKVSVQSSDNRINWLQPINIPIPISPTNYAPTSPTLGGHLGGIDLKLGALSSTTAGQITRVWFTADQTTITAGTFDLTNPLNKGTVASHQQTVVNDDNEKKYFLTDIIGQPFAMATTFPIGLYSGNLSVSTTPTNANQKFTVELYKCNNAGTPIASGVTGAVVGDLGVTVIMIMDSGDVTLANASITNVPVSVILGSAFSISVGERIRYHVSAAKVGTAGTAINESVYYGSSYNSFIDVPVIYNSSSIKDVSTVTNGSGTVTDALNTLKDAIPVNYSKIVYVNNVNPNSATIFDDENPPTVNDDALKTDVTNLYVGTDASGWVYNSTSLTYVTKSSPATSSIFYNSGTTIPANNTTAPIYRTGALGVGISPTVAKVEVFGALGSRILHAYSNLTPTGGVTMLQGVSLVQVNLEDASYPSYALSGYNVNAISSLGMLSQVAQSADTGTAPLNIIQANRLSDSGLTGAVVVNRPIWAVNNFSTRLLTMQPNGNTAFIGNVTSNAIDTNTTKITITTAVSITTATTDANGIRQDGRHVVISNGATPINLTCNGGVATSYGKVGTGAITFVQGSGRTLVQLSGTAVFNGAVGSTATLWSNGATDYLAITNY